jgi:hypothetical protein
MEVEVEVDVVETILSKTQTGAGSRSFLEKLEAKLLRSDKSTIPAW